MVVILFSSIALLTTTSYGLIKLNRMFKELDYALSCTEEVEFDE